MDAKNRVDKMLETGVINHEQAQRLKASMGEQPPPAPLSSKARYRYWILAIAAALALLIGWLLHQFNTVIVAHELIHKQKADLASQYQRRHDLIPQLVTVVKRFIEHEKSTLESLTALRSGDFAQLKNVTDELSRTASQAAGDPAQQQKLGQQLHAVIVVAEQYPTLRSGDQFMALQAQIEGSENRINIARLKLNQATTAFNSLIKTIPQRWMAAGMGYQPETYFEAAPEARSSPIQSW